MIIVVKSMKLFAYSFFIFTFLAQLFFPTSSYAITDCSSLFDRVSVEPSAGIRRDNPNEDLVVTFAANALTPNTSYKINWGLNLPLIGVDQVFETNADGSATVRVANSKVTADTLGDSIHIDLIRPDDKYCRLKTSLPILPPGNSSCTITITNPDNNTTCGDASTTFTVNVSNISSEGSIPASILLTNDGGYTLGTIRTDAKDTATGFISASNLSIGEEHASTIIAVADGKELCSTSTPLVVLDNQEQCSTFLNTVRAPGIFRLCQQAGGDVNGANECESCMGEGGIWTALGCLPTRPADLLPKLAQFAVGIAGGFALMLMLIGAFRISVSAGNPDNVQAGKDMFTSAVAGLLLIIFSALILRIIGVDIFQLPGF